MRPRVVGTLDCFQVLERLSDYLEGSLDEAARGAVIEHVRGCDACATFGERYARAIEDLRRAPPEPREVPQDVARRLKERLGLG